MLSNKRLPRCKRVIRMSTSLVSYQDTMVPNCMERVICCNVIIFIREPDCLHSNMSSAESLYGAPDSHFCVLFFQKSHSFFFLPPYRLIFIQMYMPTCFKKKKNYKWAWIQASLLQYWIISAFEILDVHAVIWEE